MGAVLPLPPWNGGLNTSPTKLPPEISAVIALVSSQANWTLARSPLRSRHLHPVHHLQPHGDLSHIGCSNQKSQWQSITFRNQVYGAAFAFPAVGYILTPFLAGTKLPSRKAWRQSNLA